jgi:hypothetical protein
MDPFFLHTSLLRFWAVNELITTELTNGQIVHRTTLEALTPQPIDWGASRRIELVHGLMNHDASKPHRDIEGVSNPNGLTADHELLWDLVAMFIRDPIDEPHRPS